MIRLHANHPYKCSLEYMMQRIERAESLC